MDSLPPQPKWRRYLRFWRADIAADVDDELRGHVEARTDDLIAGGMFRALAAAQALQEMGELTVIRNDLQAIDRRIARRQSLADQLGGLATDAAYAVRRLRGTPSFTIAATLTLAIAIGATASVFGVVDGVLLKAFPYRNPDRVLALWETNPESHQPQALVAPATYFDWLAQNTTFTTLAAVGEGWQFTVTGARSAERVMGQVVTPNYFSVLGTQLVLGRPLSPDDGSPPSEAVISYGYWQRRFDGSPSAIGQTLNLENGDDQSPPPRHHAYTVVGVMPPGLPGETEMWVRLYFEPREHTMHNIRYLNVYGRLKPGVRPEAGRHDLETIAGRLAQAYPATNKNWSVVTVPLLDQLVGPVRPALVMLLAAAACVLLIGSANLANLFLVRCLAREREMALRTALGATRGRLMRELLMEAATLGVVAGALGVGMAAGGVRALRALAPATLPRITEVGLDARVIAFCALTSLATVFLFGALPAWQVSRERLADVLKEGGRGTGSAQRHRLQDGLVVVQVAVALVLLTGAGLLVAGFQHFRRMDPGFRSEGVLTARLAFTAERFPTRAQRDAFIAALLERLSAQPGVEAASMSSWLPGGDKLPLQPIYVIGEPAPDSNHTSGADMFAVTPGYFRLMGIKLLRGRDVLPSDDSRSTKVVVIDELGATRYFPGQDPLGKRIMFSYGTDTMEIVGIVGSVKENGLAAASVPELYAPYTQHPGVNGGYVALRTSGNPEARARALTDAISNLDPLVPVSHVETLSDRVIQSIGTTRFSSFLASLFAVVALLLGVVGIYSVLAYIVSQRQREIAIKVALGASRTNVMSVVIQRALLLTAIGIGLGTSAAWLLTRVLATVIEGVQPHDPAIFIGAAGLFALVALAAAAIPAYRTTRINPVMALTAT